jgi:hypothetical protein
MFRRLILTLLLSCTALVSCAAQAASQTPTTPRAANPAGDSQIYRNLAFGFRYQVPFGWVDRTKEMREQSAPPAAEPPRAGDSNSAKTGAKAGGKVGAGSAGAKSGDRSGNQGEVLLAVFERPPEAPGETVNSGVVIASESAASYPGLKQAVDYLGPLTELTTAQGFKSDGDPSIAEVDGRSLVRADFTKALTDKLAMHQSTLVLLAKGKIVSFTFIAGSEDEVDELMDGLHFVAGR